MRFINTALICAGLVLFIPLGAGLQAAEAGSGVLVNVWPLAFGVARPGSVMPVVVEIVNQAPVFEGEIEAWIGGNEDAWVVAQKVSIGRGKFRYYMYPQYPEHESDILTVRVVNQAKRVVASQVVPIMPKPGYPWIGVYAGKGRSFGPQNVPDKKAAIISLYKTDLMPDQWYGYKFLDILFWDGHEAVMLTKDQQKAIESWVAQGGRLILTARTGDRILMPPFSGGVLPAAMELVSTAAPDGKVCFSSKEFPAGPQALFAEIKFGLGTIVLLRSDVDGVTTLAPDALAKLLARYWPVQLYDTRSVSNAPVARFSYDSDERDGLKQLLARYSGFMKIDFRPVLYTMLFYIFMISLVEYLVLRKIGKLGWTWIVFPLQIAGFSIYSYCSFYQGQLGKNERYELVFHDIGQDSRSRLMSSACIRKSSTAPYVAMIERARFIAPITGENEVDHMMYNRQGKPTSGTVVRETTTPSADKQIAIPGYVRSLKFISEEWLAVETNLPFVCQLTFKNKTLAGRITKNQPLDVFEWFVLFQSKIWQVDAAGVISVERRAPPQHRNIHDHNAQISREELDKQLQSSMVHRVRSRVMSLIECSRDSRFRDDYYRERMGRDDMFPHYMREDEAVLFAFCEEQKEYDDMSVKTIRCYRQIIDVGTVP